ncbi:MAG: DUF4956 domain-containing protein [Planctomycetota bacterium]|jgi:hypothetical protein
MDILQTFEEFLANQGIEIPVLGFVGNLLLAGVLAFILRAIYIKYGKALSNRQAFARNFILITMTTTLIISVVKSSLALSLGLVGALSVVRFRAAIKEPEELAYLFLAIAIGLGLGADQRSITLIAFIVITGVIWVMKYTQRSEENQNLYLTVSSHNPDKAELKEIVQVLKEHCAAVNLKRFDTTNELLEAAFLVEFGGFSELEKAKSALQQLGDKIKITFMDSKGLPGV